MISSLSAAKALCKISYWNMTNLLINKILYFANMVYLYKKNKPLIDEKFEAWKYGPVLPSVYEVCRRFGRKQITKDCFDDIDNDESESSVNQNSEEYKTLKLAYNHFKRFRPHQLVRLSHRKNGAWDKVYNPRVDDTKIPDDEIKNEYKLFYFNKK